jgi:hypothetical protein
LTLAEVISVKYTRNAADAGAKGGVLNYMNYVCTRSMLRGIRTKDSRFQFRLVETFRKEKASRGNIKYTAGTRLNFLSFRTLILAGKALKGYKERCECQKD